MNTRLIASFLICTIIFLACGKKEVTDENVKEDYTKTYFSFRQFTADQFRSHMGSPFVMVKLVDDNGKKDSIVMNSYNADWGEILKTFFAADIGKAKYTGKYRYSSFTDESSSALVHYYEAIEKNLFTRVVQIRVDRETNHILSIYVETSKNSFWSGMTEKLYYVSMKEVQIQRTERPLIGSSKTLKLNYRFGL